MPLILDQPRDAGDLHGRLDDLRRRLRRRTMATGLCVMLAAVIACVAIACWLDFALQLPATMRALLLGIAIVTGLWLVQRRLWSPLDASNDELSLALFVEKHHPELGDSLASAVEFARGDPRSGSEALRHATERFAVRSSRHLNFSELADDRTLLIAIATFVVVSCCTALFFVRTDSRMLLARFLDPYGNHPWPTKTRLEATAASELARGESFEIAVRVERVVPDRAIFTLALDEAAPAEHAYPLTASADGRDEFAIKLEPGRVPRSFRYRIVANDADTDWRRVAVHIPPGLAELEGRPSPRIRLDYPAYTGLSSATLPDGAAAIDAVLGTSVQLSAGFDRRLSRAAVAPRMTVPRTASALCGLIFASDEPTVGLGFLPAATILASPWPLRLDESGTHGEGTFQPQFDGTYDLTMKDATGQTGRKAIEIRVAPDPSPRVTLERPTASTDVLELAADGAFSLRSLVDDPMYAIRRVAIEYRTQPDERPRQIVLYDGALGESLSQLLGGWPTAKLRPAFLEIDRRISVAEFHHANGRSLWAGDNLTFSVIAEDFDDVSPGKSPGRSHEVDLQIVSRERIDDVARKQRQEVAAGLRDVLARQAEVGRRLTDAHRERLATGRLDGNAAVELEKADTDERMIQERLGGEQAGLRGQGQRLRRFLADNATANAAARDRAERLADGLKRLGREMVEPIQSKLAAARKESGAVPPERRAEGPLADALSKQAETERQLRDLIELAEAGNVAEMLAIEAAGLAAEQRKLMADRGELSKQLPAGATPSSLTAKERDALNRLRDRQAELGVRAGNLTQQIDSQAEASKNKDGQHKPWESASRAARGGEQADSVPAQMNRAAEAIDKNLLGDAANRQATAAQQLDRVRDALRQTESVDLDRLAKEQKQAEEDVDRLYKTEEALQEQATAAKKIDDAAERKAKLESLAQEQRRLAEQARNAVQELTRTRQREAARELEEAARQMEKAADAMQRGDHPEPMQDRALDHLDQAAEDAQQTREDTEERLQRERAIILTQRLNGFTDRQAGLVAEGERLFQAAGSASGWSRSTLRSLSDLGRDQEMLAKEVDQAIEGDLKSLKVLRRLTEHAATAMNDCAKAIEQAKADGLTGESLDADRAAIRRPQDLALKRLRQLQDLLKEKPEEAPLLQGQAAGATKKKPNSSVTQQPADEMIPATAQLQALRELQAELKERIAEFGRQNPDPAKWTDANRTELNSIQKAQAELLALFDEVVPRPRSGTQK